MPSATNVPEQQHDRLFFVVNAVVSSAAVAFIAFILFRTRASLAPEAVDLRFLPAVNAVFNTLAACCLVAGYIAIRRRAQSVHRAFMIGAFTLSSLFLIGYLTFHFVHGDTKFTGVGLVRPIYFAILISHIVLSMTVVPMALTSFYFAFTKSFARHRKLNRVLLPVWLYVSVTGVVIFLMLRGF